jgi:hypothetical protein
MALSGAWSREPYPDQHGRQGQDGQRTTVGMAGFEALHAVDDGQPLAVPRHQLAGCLGHQVDPGKLAAAVAAVQPYFTAAGEPVWSLHQVKLELGLVRRPRRNHARVQVGGRWE